MEDVLPSPGSLCVPVSRRLFELVIPGASKKIVSQIQPDEDEAGVSSRT